MGHNEVITLIFTEVAHFFEEHPLNTLSAIAQGSNLCHVEVALGSNINYEGKMCNVCRIFDDDDGVVVTTRLGHNPRYKYIQLSVTKNQLMSMLTFATNQVGKPFNRTAMIRSLICPRKTTGRDYFCAELTAAILQVGGVLDTSVNAASATPYSLYKLYSKIGTVTANPTKIHAIKTKQYESNMKGNQSQSLSLQLKGVFSNASTPKYHAANNTARAATQTSIRGSFFPLQLTG